MFPNYRQLKQRTFRALSDADYALLKVEGVLKYNNIKTLKEKIEKDIPLIQDIVYNQFGLNRANGRVNTSFYFRIKEQFDRTANFDPTLTQLSNMQIWFNSAINEQRKFLLKLNEYKKDKIQVDIDYKWIKDLNDGAGSIKLDNTTATNNKNNFKNDVYDPATTDLNFINGSTGGLGTLNNFEKTLEDDLKNLRQFIDTYRLRLSNSENIGLIGDQLATSQSGTFSATWLNTLEGNQYKADWINENHVSSEKLFRFTEKKGINSSSDRMAKLKQKAFMTSVNNNKKDVNFSIDKNGIVKKYKNQSNKISLKKAYNALDNSCRENINIVSDLNDIIVSKIDMSKNYLLNNGDQSNLTQVDFNIDGKKTAIGLLAETPLREYSKHKINFRKMSLTTVKSDVANCKDIKNKPNVPIVHEDMDDDELHEHYYPIYGKKYGLYIHKHSADPHNTKDIPRINFQYFTHRFSKNPGI